jgi:hypothetical protein
MADGMTATVCTVVAARRCEVVTDGPHSRVAYTGGAWWRWLPLGAWVQSARVTPWPKVRVRTLLELAADARAEAAARAPHPVAVMPAGAQ